MRFSILLAVAVVAAPGCGGGAPTTQPTQPRVAEAFPATRWVPAEPTYVLASPTLREAQQSLRDVIESFGMVAGIDTGEVSRELRQLLAVDALSADAVAAIGVDLAGGLVVFSEDLAPTFVVHLTSPEDLGAFFDQQRARGLVTQSVVVDGTEVYSARLPDRLRVSWAIADDWLWVHFSGPGSRDDDATWFQNSRAGATAGKWSRDWQWAKDAVRLAAPAMVGVLDPERVLGKLVASVPDAARCVRLLEPVRRVGIAVEGDGKRAAGAIALELGDATRAVEAARLQVPEGFAAVAEAAPLAAQWNLDLLAVRAWLQPCLRALDEDLAWLDRFGVRGARVVVQHLDVDARSGAGAVSLDLAHDKYLAARLDDIPMRSRFERSAQFGPLAGKTLSVPFVGITLDYVLTETLALAGVGDGVLARVVGGGRTTIGPLAAIDVVPAGLSPDAWAVLFEPLLGRRAAARLGGLMQRWRDGHIRVSIQDQALVFAASGTRR